MEKISTEARSRIMKAIRKKDTKPELLVRRTVHRLGYRFRLHQSSLPGQPDLVLPSRHKVILVNGCFWHLHSCPSGTLPRSNSSYWWPKLKGNSTRDRKNIRLLKKSGWDVMVIWECETKDETELTKRIQKFLGRRG